MLPFHTQKVPTRSESVGLPGTLPSPRRRSTDWSAHVTTWQIYLCPSRSRPAPELGRSSPQFVPAFREQPPSAMIVRRSHPSAEDRGYRQTSWHVPEAFIFRFGERYLEFYIATLGPFHSPDDRLISHKSNLFINPTVILCDFSSYRVQSINLDCVKPCTNGEIFTTSDGKMIFTASCFGLLVLSRLR